ncbi:hypothetical protein HK097_002756 [Rhizophlyctis rosea]|uniref:FAD-binding PCMH-type domain-containing protein n=1 Tax=Rhizophlyctis rosea TaxID=64517 RepID=A0AAD5SIN0_9FUNG|nr:hypothetical protein HK097_002756 [Rhizophlyctis rosea]
MLNFVPKAVVAALALSNAVAGVPSTYNPIRLFTPFHDDGAPPPPSLVSCLNRNIANASEILLWKNLTDPKYIFDSNKRVKRARAPLGILWVRNKEEVPKAIKCAVAAGVRPVARSGAHSYESLSALNETFIVDLSQYNEPILVDKKKHTVTLSAGARLGHLYAAIHTADPAYAFPAGTCATVGLGGHIAAGGNGLLGRKYGLAADNVVSALVVLASGETVKADAKTNSDLFYAIRGGGGGSYGIVVQWTLKLHKSPHHFIAAIDYPDPTQLDTIFPLYYKWSQNGLRKKNNINPRYNGFDISFQFNTFRENERMLVHWAPDSPSHTAADLDAILKSAGMINNPSVNASYGISPTKVSGVTANAWLDNGRVLNDTEAVAALQVSKYNTNGIGSSRSKSDYIRGKPSDAKITELTRKIKASFKKQWATLPDNSIFWQVEVYGGKFDEIHEDFNAFSHRKDVAFSMQYKISIPSAQIGNATHNAAADRWLFSFEDLLHEYASGDHYHGYVDLDVADISSYYGGRKRYAKLQKIKRKYDPQGIFWSDLQVPTWKGDIWYGEEWAH